MRVAGGPNFRHITINGTSPNLQDVNVRQALAMAIDRTAIARALLGPLGVEPRPLGNHIFMANQQGYQDNSGEVGTLQPGTGEAAARRGRVEARRQRPQEGWQAARDQFRHSGRASPTSKQEAELVQNMLGQIGRHAARSTRFPPNDLFDKYITPGQFDFTVFSWMGTPYPISSSKSIYGKPTSNAKGELDIRQNYARVGSDEIDQL